MNEIKRGQWNDGKTMNAELRRSLGFGTAYFIENYQIDPECGDAVTKCDADCSAQCDIAFGKKGRPPKKKK